MTRNTETERPLASFAGLVAVVLGLAAVGGLVFGLAALWLSDDEETVSEPRSGGGANVAAPSHPGLLQGAGTHSGGGALANEVRGRIVGEHGKPVMGLRILVDGLGDGVSCDDDARFVVRDLAVGVHSFLPINASALEVGPSVSLEITAAKSEYDLVLRVPESYPIAGRVVTPEGDPVPALRIELWHVVDGLSAGVDPTNANGGFEARVSKSGHYVAQFQGNRLKGEGAAGQRDVVFVYEADVRDDFLVRVVDPGGNPIPSCTLSFSTDGPNRFRQGDSSYPIIDGTFRAHPDQWGWSETMTFFVDKPRDAAGKPLPFPMRVVSGVPVADGEVTIVMQPGRSISGRVVDEDGSGISKAHITAFGSPGGRPMLVGRARSDAEGRFVLPGMPTVEVTLYATAWHHLRGKGHAVPVDESAATLRLERGATFEVRVSRAEGTPVYGAGVSIAWSDSGRTSRAHATTDREGVARCEAVRHGALLTVTVLTNKVQPPTPGWFRRDVPFGEGTLDVTLRTSVPLRGTLIGTPEQLATMNVQMRGAEDSTFGYAESAKPDPKTGAFEFRTAVPGPYRVWVPNERGRAAGVETLVTAPATEVRVVAPTSVVVEGRLFAKHPQSWRLQWCQEPVGAMALIGPEGHFKISAVRADRGALLAHSPDRSQVAVLPDIDATEGPFELRATQAHVIRGRVENPPESTHLWVRVSLGNVKLTASVLDGAFEIGGVPPGPWTVELRSGNDLLDRMEGVDQTTDIVLRGSK